MALQRLNKAEIVLIGAACLLRLNTSSLGVRGFMEVFIYFLNHIALKNSSWCVFIFSKGSSVVEKDIMSYNCNIINSIVVLEHKLVSYTTCCSPSSHKLVAVRCRGMVPLHFLLCSSDFFILSMSFKVISKGRITLLI